MKNNLILKSFIILSISIPLLIISGIAGCAPEEKEKIDKLVTSCGSLDEGDIYNYYLSEELDNNETCLTLSDNIILDCRGNKIKRIGARLNESYDAGITAADLKNIHVKNCQIEGFMDGIYLNNVHDTIIENNSISNFETFGIYLYGSEYVNLSDNNIQNGGVRAFTISGTGISVENSRNIEVTKNKVSNIILTGINILKSSVKLAENDACSSGSSINFQCFDSEVEESGNKCIYAPSDPELSCLRS